MKDLVELAIQAREHAYAPYSQFRVGAALRAASGRVYVGVNVENAAYPAGICAERTALVSAVAAGERQFEAIAIVTDTPEPSSPCGVCRQMLAEFGVGLKVTLATVHGAAIETTLDALLPRAFGPESLARR